MTTTTSADRALFDAWMERERPTQARMIANGTASIDLKAEWLVLFTGWCMGRAAIQAAEPVAKAAHGAVCRCGRCEWREYYTGPTVTHMICANCDFKVRAVTITAPDRAPSIDSAAGWVAVADRLPEVGVGVMVYSPPLKGEGPEDYRLDFDCIDPNDDEHASWLNHNEHYEHYCCVGKPEDSTGPRAEAPYTHWMPLPPAPAIAALQPEGEKT